MDHPCYIHSANHLHFAMPGNVHPEAVSGLLVGGDWTMILSTALTSHGSRTLSLAFETTLFALTLFRFASTVVAVPVHRHSILFVLVRDGTWAYAIIFGK